MTQEFRTSLLELLRNNPEELTNFRDYHMLKLMIPWIETQFGAGILDLNPENKEERQLLKSQSINWKKYQELTGIPRLDFFLNVPQFSGYEGDKTKAYVFEWSHIVYSTGDSGQSIQTPITEPRKLIGRGWNHGYPMPTIGSLIAHNTQGNKSVLTNGIIADIIESFYLPVASFAECDDYLPA